MKNLVIVFLLVLAGAHCTLSVFYDNENWLDLPKYAVGEERNPYQERIAMAPLLRLAAESTRMQRWSHWLEQRNQHVRFHVSLGPEELASLMAAIGCVWAALLVCCQYGRERTPELWWLPAALMLAILYASYAARYEHALWFPYDLPHMFLFGSACACLLTGRPWLALLFFALDTPMRETSIYFIPLLFCMAGRRMSLKHALGFALLCASIWVAIRVPIAYAYRHNPTETGSRLLRNMHVLAHPADWATLASAVGFLLIPVWLGRRHLDGTARAFLWLTVPCLAFTSYFGILIETRIFVEWTIPFALLAATEVMCVLPAAAAREREANQLLPDVAGAQAA